jgi:hypothetical protein
MQDLQSELAELQHRTRARRSVDDFARAAIEGFVWMVLTGICAKLLHDSRRVPYLFWVLALLDLYLLRDAIRSYRRARAELRGEIESLERLREVRAALGIDPPQAVQR